MRETIHQVLCAVAVALFISSCLTEQISSDESSEKKWQKNSAGKPYSIAKVAAPDRPGNAYRFELRSGEKYTSRRGSVTYRSEIDTNDSVQPGSTQWYGLSIYIPKDFPIENNRLVMGQWYADSDPGEISRSPAMAQRFVGGRFYVTVRHSAERIQKTDGKEEVIYQTEGLQLGKWNDFVYQVKWSYLADGFVNMWLNGSKVAAYQGPVGYNDEKGPAFQFGLYRDDSEKTYVVYFDKYSRGARLDEVDPRVPR